MSVCPARCYVGDKHGDGEAIFRCELAEGHEPPHAKTFRDGDCRLTWGTDDRERCDRCGQPIWEENRRVGCWRKIHPNGYLGGCAACWSTVAVKDCLGCEEAAAL